MLGGKEIRMQKIFKKDGRAVVVALDHASGMGPLPGVSDPGAVIEKLVAGGLDGILTTPGVVKNFGDKLGNCGIILRVDGGSTLLGTEKKFGRLFGPDLALDLGADALCTMGFAGVEDELEHWEYISELSEECQSTQLPYMIEALPMGQKAKEMEMEKSLATACRIACELGGDFIKTSYPGSPEAMAEVAKECYLPMLVLGGPKMDDDRALLETVKGAIEGGAAGICMGRNIWQHENPEGIVSAIAEIIHGDASVEAALKHRG